MTEHITDRVMIDRMERDGYVIDSLVYRARVIGMVRRGDITLEQAKKHIINLKETAKRRGQVTRKEFWKQQEIKN